jgi:drug/metabolite transporter (DMT)-like permease
MLLIVGLAADGAALLAAPTVREAIALGYMAAIVTAGGFVAWYGSIARLGVERAGLFSGVLPVTALFTGALLGHADITTGRIAGIAVVAAGITAGLVIARQPVRPLARPGNSRPATHSARSPAASGH